MFYVIYFLIQVKSKRMDKKTNIKAHMGPNPDWAPTRTGPQPGPGPNPVLRKTIAF